MRRQVRDLPIGNKITNRSNRPVQTIRKKNYVANAVVVFGIGNQAGMRPDEDLAGLIEIGPEHDLVAIAIHRSTESLVAFERLPENHVEQDHPRARAEEPVQGKSPKLARPRRRMLEQKLESAVVRDVFRIESAENSACSHRYREKRNLSASRSCALRG